MHIFEQEYKKKPAYLNHSSFQEFREFCES